jgi:hypothetical protein
MLTKVISGGQTGDDQAALRAAKALRNRSRCEVICVILGLS